MQKTNSNTVTNLPCVIQLPDGYELSGRVDVETYELEDEFDFFHHSDEPYLRNTDFRAEARFRKGKDGVLFKVTKKKSVRQIKVEHRVMGPVDFRVISKAYSDVEAPDFATIEIVDGGGMAGMKCIIFRWDE